IGASTIQPLIAEVDQAIDVAAAAIPFILMVERDAPAALQAVALVGSNDRPCRIGKAVKPDVGISHLDLRRDAELAADGRALANLDTEGLAVAIIVTRQF